MATVLTYVGEDWLVQRAAGSGSMSSTTMPYVAWGTGGTTAAKGDTTLGTEAPESRVSGTVSVTGSGTTAKWQNVATITATASRAIIEAGVFDAASSGNMAIRGDFTTINLATDDSIQFTFTLDPS